MRLRTRALTTIGALGVAASTAIATAPGAATASTPAKFIVVQLSSKAVTFPGGTTIPAGDVVFKATTAKGDHQLQLLQLHSGYTKKQAESDINAAFEGKVAAVKRIDKNITWLGGNETTAGHPGWFAVHLAAGDYIAVDQEGNAPPTAFTVVASPASYRTVYPSSLVTTKDNRFHTHTSLALPHDGWLKYHNNAVEPHMFVLQQVKQSTTKRDVRDYVASGSQKPPSWGLKASTGASVISPGTTQVFHYNVPAGKYLVACFWPSKQTGMPHFAMGMWKLVELS